jgi:hypothetical protein
MDPSEILRHSTEIAKVGTAVGAAIPFTAVVKKILGPAADEIAQRVRDEIRVYRFGRQLSLLRKAERIALEAGFKPTAVPTKLLFSLLEGASLEEDEGLHDKWAALLANSANPGMTKWVRPSFADTLTLMTPEVAQFLDTVFDQADKPPSTILPASDLAIGYHDDFVAKPTPLSMKRRALTRVDLGTYDSLFNLFGKAGGTVLPTDSFLTSESPNEDIDQDESDRQDFAVIMDELMRFQMWDVRSSRNSGDHYYLSSYAVQFLMACRKPDSNAY